MELIAAGAECLLWLKKGTGEINVRKIIGVVKCEGLISSSGSL